MSTNSHHGSFQGKDYARKDLNYGSARRDFTSEKGLESQNSNFSSHATRNSPLASVNQKDLSRDSFDKNSPDSEPLQVKHLQNHQQKQYQQQIGETGTPPQPIINDKTLLALDYLQKHLLPNRTIQEINLPSKGTQDQEPLYLNDSENFVSRNSNGELIYPNPKITEIEPNKRTKDSIYLTDGEKYERSRSRSNERKGPYDRRAINAKKDRKQQDSEERYRSSYNKSYKSNREGFFFVQEKYICKKRIENTLEQSRKAESLDQDWECLQCGNVNWVKQRNCKKCGNKQSLNNNPLSPDGEYHSYKGESQTKRNDHRNNKNFNSSGK